MGDLTGRADGQRPERRGASATIFLLMRICYHAPTDRAAEVVVGASISMSIGGRR